ncbi:MAG: hypothetical protein JWL72_2296 [Ilumatobacteraceae bacterium]|nr:hypothetical protein [Ilumatobacteraceae bacterium]
MTPNRTSRALAATIAFGAIAIAGCSSDSKSVATTTAAAVTTVAATAAPTTAAATPPATEAPAATDAATTVAASTPGSAAASGATMSIKGFKFSDVTASAGQEITVTNDDTAPHTVTADDGSFNVKVAPGTSATFTVPKAGTYAIHCTVHPNMKSSITIS